MENFEVCLCNKVMRNTIVKAIHEKELTNIDEVQFETKNWFGMWRLYF